VDRGSHLRDTPGRIRDEPEHRDGRQCALRHSLVRATHCRIEPGGRPDRAARRGVGCDVSVKANLMSKTRERLEVAARGVTEAASQALMKLMTYDLSEAGREGGRAGGHGGA
jgi:hypothetical protein